MCVARPRTVAVGEGETARLACHVEAEPDDQLTFTWVFNNTLDTVHVPHHRLSPLRGLSILDYTPRCVCICTCPLFISTTCVR